MCSTQSTTYQKGLPQSSRTNCAKVAFTILLLARDYWNKTKTIERDDDEQGREEARAASYHEQGKMEIFLPRRRRRRRRKTISIDFKTTSIIIPVGRHIQGYKSPSFHGTTAMNRIYFLVLCRCQTSSTSSTTSSSSTTGVVP